MEDQPQLKGKIAGDHLANIFSRASQLQRQKEQQAAEDGQPVPSRRPETQKLGKSLLHAVLKRARQESAQSDTFDALGSFPPPRVPEPPGGAPEQGGAETTVALPRAPRSRRVNLSELRAQMAEDAGPDVLEPDQDLPQPREEGKPIQFRREGGRLGTRTLDNLFVRGKSIRFEGHMEEVENLLVELYDEFRSSSADAAVDPTPTLLGEAATDGLETRRARERARRDELSRDSDVLRALRPAWEGETDESNEDFARLAAPFLSGSPSATIRDPELVEAAESQPQQVSQGPGAPAPAVAQGWDEVAHPEPDPVQRFVEPGLLTVRCGCNVERQIDTSQLGPWRVRCKRCQVVLFDPATTLVVGGGQSSSGTLPISQRLHDSQELRPISASETMETSACQIHAGQPLVAACRSCERLLCAACVEQVGDDLTCAACAVRQAGLPDAVPLAPVGQLAVPVAPRQVSPAATAVREAFEKILNTNGFEGLMDRSGVRRLVRVLYDPHSRLFKAPLETPLEPGDRIKLHDGRTFTVMGVRGYDIAGEPCYQEIAWNAG